MAEVTSGNVTVLILTEREASKLRFALWQWEKHLASEGGDHVTAMYEVMESLGVFDIETV